MMSLLSRVAPAAAETTTESAAVPDKAAIVKKEGTSSMEVGDKEGGQAILARVGHRVGRRLNRLLDGGRYQVFSAALLFLSLFLSESWTLGNARDSQNDALGAILVAVFAVFSLEVLAFSAVQKGYFLSFFFWMDLLGTISILLDISWVVGTLLKKGGSASILRATRAAKLGARYGRLMRILKLMRFVQYMPCFRKKDDGKAEPTMSSVRRVSNELSNALSQRVAFIVMTLVIVLPFLVYTAIDDSDLVTAWLSALKATVKDARLGDEAKRKSVIDMAAKFRGFFDHRDAKVKTIHIESPYWKGAPIHLHYHTRDNLRDDNIMTYEKDFKIDGMRYIMYADMDETQINMQNSLFGIVIIIIVIVLLVGGASSFQNAVDRIVVVPLEKMTNALRSSASVMLRSMKVMEEEKKKDGDAGFDEDDEDDEGELETQMLEKMVEKLARVASHIMPAAVQFDDKNVDKDTVSWLSSQYTTMTRVFVADEAKATDKDAESRRIRQISSIDAVVSPDVINSWQLDVLDYTHAQLIDVWIYVFSVLNVCDEFSVSEAVLRAFLAELAVRYVNENTYHNFKHGCDVGHTVYRILTVPQLNLVFTHLEVFSMLVAAIGHDVGHPGVNNVYLVKSKNELALRHNDKSPLENMHCTVIYEVLKRDKTNIFSGLTEQQWRDARKIILTTVLGTDMSHHFAQISNAQLFLEVNGEDIHSFCAGKKDTIDCLAQEKDRLFLLELCLHCADISNPYKPWSICEKWAHLVVEEFARQGDRERSEGLEISPMCDRATINLCNSQLGFIEFVVAPLVIAFVNILPPLHEIGSAMASNVHRWGELRKKDIWADGAITDREGECKKVDERIGKFADKMSFTAALAAKPLRAGGVDSARTAT